MCITFYLLARRENRLILISLGDCNRWGMMKRYFSLLLIAAFVGGCASSTAIEAPTWTPEAPKKIPTTIEVEPSDTPTVEPTFTLIRPTLTFTPTATDTPSLTPTATRTRTPLPTHTRTPKPMLVPTKHRRQPSRFNSGLIRPRSPRDNARSCTGLLMACRLSFSVVLNMGLRAWVNGTFVRESRQNTI